MPEYQNGEILDTLGEKIEGLLKQKRLSATTKAHLEIEQMLLIYLKNDHQKVTTMWAYFRPMAWVMSIAAGVIITLLFSGRVQVAFIP